MEAWDALAAAMRTTEAWEYSPWGELRGISDPPPDPHSMILRVGTLKDRGLYAGVDGDRIYSVSVHVRTPWGWVKENWVRPWWWESHSLRVERDGDGWKVTRMQRPVALRRVD